MQKIKELLRRRRREERGAVLIFTLLSMVLLLWAGATGVDLGFSVYGSRQAQAIADTTAIDLARYINYADTLSVGEMNTFFANKAETVLDDNGYPNAHLTVVPGYYASSTGKFTAGGISTSSNPCAAVKAPQIPAPGCNAIEVTANQTVPQIFFGGFNALPGHAGNTVTGSVARSSIATQTPYAGFSIGTFLINVSSTSNQASVLNLVLGPLGTSVNLTAVGYEGLAYSDLTLAQLINASSGLLSPTNVMTAQLTAAQWVSVYENAFTNVYGSGSVPYAALSGQVFSTAASTQIPLCQMVNINTSAGLVNCTNSSITQQGLDASVNVLQMLTTEAELADGTSGINLGSTLTLPDGALNIGSVTLSFSAIKPAVVAYGPVGTTASTEQVALDLKMSLSLPAPLNTPLGTLDIPLDAATGTTTLYSVSCSDDSLNNMLLLPTNTGLVSTGTGSAGMTLTLLGLQTDLGQLSVSGVSNKSPSFNGPASPPSVVPPTASTASAGTNPVTVSGSQSPTITWPNDSGILSLLDQPVASLLSTGSVLSDALQPLLTELGVTAAGAQVAGLSANCGSIALVQ
ncbi:MAG TPA: hypothetical protein VIY26_01195 [Acidimicrobiales bacterium]